jgi:N-methylhydantoinase A/oxoprolinase/acetone carboxylase beta subunit
MAYSLGIDTGGTFTDAVLLNAQRQVVASAKSLTTRFDLAQGIAGALDQLPQEWLAQVTLVSLSTTLTTNSVVEGRGSPVCVLLAGYDALQLKSSGLVDLLGSEGIVCLSGGHDAGGIATQALDEAAARAAGSRAFAATKSGSIAAMAAAKELARLRSLVDPFSATPESGYQVGGQREQPEASSSD